MGKDLVRRLFDCDEGELQDILECFKWVRTITGLPHNLRGDLIRPCSTEEVDEFLRRFRESMIQYGLKAGDDAKRKLTRRMILCFIYPSSTPSGHIADDQEFQMPLTSQNTLPEKMERLKVIFGHPIMKKWPDHKIAEMCGVSIEKMRTARRRYNDRDPGYY